MSSKRVWCYACEKAGDTVAEVFIAHHHVTTTKFNYQALQCPTCGSDFVEEVEDAEGAAEHTARLC